MAWVLGETVSQSIYTGNTGETFTRVASYINGSASTWNPTITELGSGYYRWSYTPAVAGSFEWSGTGSAGSPLPINFDVEATGVTVSVAAATSGSLTQTLAQLRNRVADRLGDRLPLTATSNGLVSTFKDNLNVTTATENLLGRWLVLSDGTVHVISGQTNSSSTLTLTPDAASTSFTATGQTANLYNKRGKGFRPDEYKNAINNAINDAFPLGLIAVRASIVAVFDSDNPEVTIPASVTHITTVEYQDSNGDWHQVPKSMRSTEYGWKADPAAGELRIFGFMADQIDGLSLRVTGFGRQDVLSADSDTCALNAEFIVSRACYHLCASAIDKDAAFYGSLVNLYMQESDRMRKRLRTLSSSKTLVRAS